MAILLTGGTGKTATAIARLLQEANVPFLLASRRGEAAASPGMPAIRFDWLDSSTWENPFEYQFAGGEHINAVYLVVPTVPDIEPVISAMIALIDYARKEHRVKRFVLLASSTAKPGGPRFGQQWKHLLDIGIDYTVLRPNWFMENLLEEWHVLTIKNEGKVYTASADGRIAFVGVTDIAAAAFRALTDEKPHNTSHTLLGPELLTHDEIAEKLSTALGNPIVHVRLTEEERVRQLLGYGAAEEFATRLAFIEVTAANGIAAITENDFERVVGRPPTDFDTFIKQNKTTWQ